MQQMSVTGMLKTMVPISRFNKEAVYKEAERRIQGLVKTNFLL